MSYCPKCGGVVEPGKGCWRCGTAPNPKQPTEFQQVYQEFVERVPAPVPPQPEKQRSGVSLGIGIGVGVAIGLLAVFLVMGLACGSCSVLLGQ